MDGFSVKMFSTKMILTGCRLRSKYFPFLFQHLKLNSDLQFHIPDTKSEREFYFFIMLAYFLPHQKSYHSDMLEIFELCWNLNIKNAIIMIKPSTQTYYSFYTYRIYSKQHCGSQITLDEINRYNSGHLQRPYLFPDHVNEFNGCTLMVCGHIIPPLLTFYGNPENATHLRDMQRLGGIEGEILKLVAQTLNANLEYRFTQKSSNTQLDMRNASGCFAEVCK